MKRKTDLLPLFTLLAGGIGLLLRLWLLSGMDENGLLKENHPAGVLLFILLAAVMAAAFLCVRPLKPVKSYERLFPASVWSAAGCFAAAAGVLVQGVYELTARRDAITVITLVLAVAAAACLIMLALCRWKGRKPSYLLQTVLTVYLMFHLISQYRQWSAEPQLQVYFFQLLASVFLMLTAYHAAVMDAQKGSRRWYVFCNQGALFCCCVSLTEGAWLFYLAMALFTATNLCSLYTRASHSQKPEEAA